MQNSLNFLHAVGAMHGAQVNSDEGEAGLSLRRKGGGGSSFTHKESTVECSFTGKEPAVEYEVEGMKCEKMKK